MGGSSADSKKVPAVEAFHRLEVETLRKQIAGLQE